MVVKFWRSRTGLIRKQDLQGPGPGWIGLDQAGLELGVNRIWLGGPETTPILIRE